MFIREAHCLPSSNADNKKERTAYGWLRVQWRRLLASEMPNDMQEQLRSTHPLIDEFVAETLRARDSSLLGAMGEKRK